jgi:glycosyltransferase involved in cell wall biosynthesis
MKNQQTIILIPCYNEIKNLPLIIKKLKNYNILVVNDHSSDGTKKFLEKNKINHINAKKQLGQLNAIIMGFRYIIQNYKKCEYIITFDADGEHKVSDIKKFMNKRKFNPDIIMGVRNRKNRIMENIISFLFYYKYKIKDPMTGFKMIKTKIIKENFNYLNNRHFFIDFLSEVSSKAKILNVNITSPKRKGSSKHEGFITNINILRTIFAVSI